MTIGRIGVFGGNFDPFHYGHLNSMQTIASKLGLDEVRVIPASVSPLRLQTQGASTEQRLEMLRRGLTGNEDLVLDTREIERGGVSYTIDTIESLKAENNGFELFLIIGMDQFLKFDQWKSYDKLLSLVDLVVTTRPGMELPADVEEWPTGVRSLIADHDSKQAMLKTGHSIHFVALDDIEASGTEIRKKVRLGQSIQEDVPPGIAEYIREQKLYESVQRSIGDFERFTHQCVQMLNDKGAINPQIFDLRDRSAPSEFTLVASGTSTRHTAALGEHIIREVKKEYGVWPESIEGQVEGRWVVIDYGALIIHIFYDYVRNEYRLEELWSKPRA